MGVRATKEKKPSAKPAATDAPHAAPRINDKDRSVLGLKLLRDQLGRSTRANASFCEQQTAVARERLAGGDRIGALRALRRKRLYEQQTAQLEAQLENIETMIASVEFAQLQGEVMRALKTGTTTLNELQRTMSLADVEKVVEDAAEAVERTKEVSDLLAQMLTPADEEAAAEALHDLELSAIKVPAAALPETQKSVEPTAEVRTVAPASVTRNRVVVA